MTSQQIQIATVFEEKLLKRDQHFEFCLYSVHYANPYPVSEVVGVITGLVKFRPDKQHCSIE